MKDMEKRIYISGKIGEKVISETTRQKFARAQEMLKAKGWTVLNPAGYYYQTMMANYFRVMSLPADYATILHYDLGRVKTCHTVYFLDDFTKSPGAMAEFSFAQAIGRELFFEDAEDAQSFVDSTDFDKWREVWLPID